MMKQLAAIAVAVATGAVTITTGMAQDKIVQNKVILSLPDGTVIENPVAVRRLGERMRPAKGGVALRVQRFAQGGTVQPDGGTSVGASPDVEAGASKAFGNAQWGDDRVGNRMGSQPNVSPVSTYGDEGIQPVTHY